MAAQDRVARSVVSAITRKAEKPPARSLVSLVLGFLAVLFSLYQIPLRKVRPAWFAKLRHSYWDIQDEEYHGSFEPPDGEAPPEHVLNSMGDMGLSGSTFYRTQDGKYMVKSITRHSEHTFFTRDLLTPYVEHMENHPESMLVRVLDFLEATGVSIGRCIGLAPAHHMVMENILHGKEEGDGVKWETWDLKPQSYFVPERDMAGGQLTSEATKDRLADEFHDKVVLTKRQADDLFENLERDTELLARYNAVDYSLFLVRLRQSESSSRQQHSGSDTPASSLSLSAPTPLSWRSGVPSADKEYVFRAVILDFFWAKHKARPMFMTFLVNVWDFFTGEGPMTTTTDPDEYRRRFLEMCREIVVVRDGPQGNRSQWEHHDA